MEQMEQLRQRLEQALEQHRQQSGIPSDRSDELLQRLLGAVQESLAAGDDSEPAINGPCIA